MAMEAESDKVIQITGLGVFFAYYLTPITLALIVSR